jgi:hypothetical protein
MKQELYRKFSTKGSKDCITKRMKYSQEEFWGDRKKVTSFCAVELCPPPKYIQVPISESVNVTLFEIMVLAVVIEKSSSNIRVRPTPMTFLFKVKI